jgi:GDP-4-dehydro-6-deoxy-D-mannose reductase
VTDSTFWITGAAGYTGRHQVAFMRSLPDCPRLIGLDLNEPEFDGLDAFEPVDALSAEAVAEVARQYPPDWVIHLAGAMPPADEARMYRINVGGAMGLLQGLGQAGRTEARVVGIGSAAEYVPRTEGPLTEACPCGNVSAYGRAKWAQTLVTMALGRELGIDTMAARPFNLIGPGLPTRLVAGRLCEQFADPTVQEIEIGNTQSSRDFVDIRDAVRAYWLIAQHGHRGEVYNVCTGTHHTVEHLLSLFADAAGRRPDVRVDASRFRAAEASISVGDYSKLSRLTDWHPRHSLAESVNDMLVACKLTIANRTTQD